MCLLAFLRLEQADRKIEFDKLKSVIEKRLIYIYVLYGGDTVELNRVDSNDEIYTGVLRYKDDDINLYF